MLKEKNKILFTRIFVYSITIFLFIFLVLLLQFNQISKEIDNNQISPNSILFGLPSIDLLRDYQPKELSKIISSDNKFGSIEEIRNLLIPVILSKLTIKS